jgi:hypothetical protein
MKITTIKKLQEQFVNKVCTVLTTGIGKNNLQDHQFADFFTGIVESIDEDGIFTRHHLTGCKNFYSMQFVVGLLEEQVIDENNPEYENIVNQVKKNTPNNNPMIIGVDPSASPYVDPATLAALSKQAQEFNKKMINKGGS